MSSSRPRDPFQDSSNTGQREHVRGSSESRHVRDVSVSTSASGNAKGMSRAERFEDEMRRIIESCFSKKELDGSAVESYITHIQIIEDGASPSAPAPPESSPETKKPRAIIVAVRKSGRVRVHKARENNSGTYSIGKTWNLDDLSAIQSWTGAVPATAEEEQHKKWASDIGFTVTLGKPYYWRASTSREREFFIGSLIKVYRRYTGGKLPDMIGFDPAEQEQITGLPPQRPSPELQPRSPLPRPNLPPSFGSRTRNRDLDDDPSRRPPSLSPAPYGSRAPSRDGDLPRSRNGFRPQDRNPGPDELRSPRRGEFQDPGRDRSADRTHVRRAPSAQGSMSSLSNQNAVLKPRPPFSAHSSQSSLPPALGLPSNPRSGSTGPSPAPPHNGDALSRLAGQASDNSLFNQSEDGASNSSRPSTATSALKSSEARMDRVPTPDLPPEALPERRRPPWQRPEGSFGTASAKSDVSSNFTTPTATPTQVRSDLLSPPGSGNVERTEPKTDARTMPGYFPSSAEANATGQPHSAVTSPNNLPTVNEGMTLSPSSESPITSPSSQFEEEYRPGLGPMMRKKKSGKDIANQFRKAAFAASVFKPRVGGAAERLLAQKEKSPNEPDGITGVVPAPLMRGTSNDSRNGTPDLLSPASDILSPPPPQVTPTVLLQRSPTEEQPLTTEAEEKDQGSLSPERPRSRSPGRRRRQLQEARISKYCVALDIDSKLLEGRGGDFDDLLTEMGWEGKLSDEKKIEDFEADVRREIGRAQASGWLGHIEQQEGKLEQLGKLFGVTIDECDELDGLLTLYSHELNTLAEDVAYIEAQSQGLQVQTANQKLLQVELKNLLKTISISSADLRHLRDASLRTPEGVETAEQSLTTLYRAMITIDPDIRQNKKRKANAAAGSRTDVGVYADTEIGQMRAVREKKESYRDETSVFLKRLSQYMSMAFKSAESRISDQLDRARGNTMLSAKSLDPKLYDSSRQEMWMYNALMLFVREVNSYEWQTLISTYETCFKSPYQEQLRDNIAAWKKSTRQPTSEELDFLFTVQEKERPEDGITTAARKLTVKRGKTVRATGSLGKSVAEKRDGKVDAHEAVAAVLEGHLKLISEEQNFSVSFFHLSSLSHVDFADIVAGKPPGQRQVPNLSAKQTYDPDRDMARVVERLMDSVYAFWPSDIQGLVEWALSTDPLQGVGILYTLERCLVAYEDTNQEYLTRTLRTVHSRLLTLFQRFVDDQVRGIEDTKVKLKKRKGIISFMRTFPNFSAAAEAMLPPTASGTGNETLEVRLIVNEVYGKINKAMWECLNFIAKDEPGGVSSSSGHHHGAISASHVTAAGATTTNDPEDKETLNYHILLIENMNHYLEEVEVRSNPILRTWREHAARDLSSHLSAYVDAVIRRPLGRWLEFIEASEVMLNGGSSSSNNDNKSSILDNGPANTSTTTTTTVTSEQPGPANAPPPCSASVIAHKATHSRASLKKLLAAHDSREIRKGVETLKKRIEKHFAEGDDPALARCLVGKVLAECVGRYGDAWERMGRVVRRLYGGDGGANVNGGADKDGVGGAGAGAGAGAGCGVPGLEIEWKKEEAAALLRR